MFLISPAYAEAAAGGGSTGALLQMAPLALIFVVFYLFLIRPQQKKAKQTKSMLEAIRRGDRVVTGGGIIGTVAKVINEEVLIDIADNTRVRVVRSTIVNVLAKTAPAEAKAGRGGKSSKDDEDNDEDDGDEADAAKDKTRDSAKAG